MTAEVDDGFFQLFERRIFVRGEAYYDAGKVDPPVMIAENLWHTVVRGNDDYQVDIRLRHGKVISAACACQYSQRATYCKHVAAVLILMRESRRRELDEIIYVFLTIFLYLLKCPQSLILSALRAFCFCGKSHIPRSIFLYFRYQSWLKSW